MLTAMQAAVVAAAAAFVAGIVVAGYDMLKAARLMSQASAAIAGLREREDLLIERANATIDKAGEQIARTETVTAAVEGVTASMSELGGHLTALAPAPPAPDATTRPLTWAAALVSGVRWAVGVRLPAGREAPRQPARPAREARQAGWPAREAARRAALTGRTNGTRR